jgi:hypothetical protein
LIDRVSGKVFPGFTVGGAPKLEFSRDSRMVVVRHTDGMYGDLNPFSQIAMSGKKTVSGS